MDPSDNGAPVRRSFPVGTRAPANTASHLCFFCGHSFPVAAEYQRHLVDHQMVSLAYQTYANGHPDLNRRGEERREEEEEDEDEDEEREEVKEDKKEVRKIAKAKRGRKGEEEKEKKSEMDSPSTSAGHSLAPPVSTRPPARSTRAATEQPSFAVPSIPTKIALPPSRQPANKLQAHSKAAAAAAKPQVELKRAAAAEKITRPPARSTRAATEQPSFAVPSLPTKAALPPSRQPARKPQAQSKAAAAADKPQFGLKRAAAAEKTTRPPARSTRAATEQPSFAVPSLPTSRASSSRRQPANKPQPQSMVAAAAEETTRLPPRSTRAATEQPSPFAVPSLPTKTALSLGRDPANQSQVQSEGAAAAGETIQLPAHFIRAATVQPFPFAVASLPTTKGAAAADKPQVQPMGAGAVEEWSKGQSTACAAQGKVFTDAPCQVCGTRFMNGTLLVMHYLREHDATILKVEVFLGESADAPRMEYEHPTECVQCDLKTPTLTKSFEHMIDHHKASLLNAFDATVVTYDLTCGASDKNLEVRIRLRKAPKE